MNQVDTLALPDRQLNPVECYYRFHSRIYDATRWSYLFGRSALIDRVAALHTPTRILEVGCGTGANLLKLRRRFPAASITGLDISEAMLAVAHRKLGCLSDQITLLRAIYDRPLQPDHPFDLVLFSYCLTMINPGWDEAIEHALCDLVPGGLIAVVDFHASPISLYRRWMRYNHVSLDGHLLPRLQSRFHPRQVEVRPAYLGWWTYLVFIGEKQGATAGN